MDIAHHILCGHKTIINTSSLLSPGNLVVKSVYANNTANVYLYNCYYT